MDVYINDMVVKTRWASNHLSDVEEVFQILKEFGLRLNPTKCVFGVDFGKFLGYLVTRRGIEGNPDQIQAL